MANPFARFALFMDGYKAGLRKGRHQKERVTDMPRAKIVSPMERFINGFLDLYPEQQDAVLEVCAILVKRRQMALPQGTGPSGSVGSGGTTETDPNTASLGPIKRLRQVRRRRRTRAEIQAMENSTEGAPAGDPGPAPAEVGEEFPAEAETVRAE